MILRRICQLSLTRITHQVSPAFDLNAGMFVKYGKEYEEICRRTGHKTEALEAEAMVKKVYDTVLEAGWDGEWFLRAYDAHSEKVGSRECEEGQIYIEPQGFCVMAGIGLEEGLAEKAMDSVQKHLETKYGIMILQPAYTRYHLELGEVSSYPPGYKENAGIFCHNNPWVSIAEPEGVQKGVLWMEVEGQKITGNQITLIPGKKEYHVIVQIG